MWFALAWRGAARLVRGTVSTGTVGLVLLAGATLGVMPFLLFVSRPEQLLLLGITIALLPALAEDPPVVPSRSGSIARAAGGVLLGMFVIAAHPRGVFVLPLLLLFIWRVAGRPRVAGVASLALAAFAVAMSSYWPERWACQSGDPVVKQFLSSFNVMVSIEHGELLVYLENLAAALMQPDTWYITRFLPRIEYSSGVIPGFSPLWIAYYSPYAASALVLVVAIGAAAYTLALADALKRRELRLPVLALGALGAFYLASVVSRLAKQAYEPAVMEPVLIFLVAGSLWLARHRLSESFGAARVRGGLGIVLGILLLLSIGSQVGLIATYLPHALGPWTSPGVPPDQTVSVSWVGYERLRPRILEAGRACGLDPTSNARHLVVDEETFYPFRSSFQPVLTTYIDETGWGAAIPDLAALLARIGSAGLIARCDRVPGPLRSSVVATGELCCHGPFGSP
jgi:hypothetical protein